MTYQPSNNPWYEIPLEEIVYCLKCNKKIWKFWKGRSITNKKETKPMKFCANCFFGR